MLDDIGAAVAGFLAGRESVRFRTIGVTSFLIGVTFFLLLLFQELMFSNKPLLFVDLLVLAGLSLFISLFTLSILFIARWNNSRREKNKPTVTAEIGTDCGSRSKSSPRRAQ